jgi:integrase
MGIFKRGPVWWMRFSYQGKQIRESTGTDDRKLAQRIFDKTKGEIAKGTWFEHLPGEDYTFAELMDKYLKEYSAVNKAKSSPIRDIRLNNHLQKHFGKFYLPEITPKMISEYKIKRRNEGASARTLNYELTVMSHAFNLATKEWEIIKDNPVQKVAKEKVRNQVERWLTDEEEKRLMSASPDWLRPIITFAIYTGFREGEILGLKWSQVDFSRREITISEQKNGQLDTLPLNKKVINVLREIWNNRQKDAEYVFPSQHNTRISHRNLFRAFQIAKEKAKIEKFRFHDLRHTFATRLVQSGVDIYAVQKLGRWKTLSMVTRYGHFNTESLRSSIEVMDKVEKKISTNLAQCPKKKGHKPQLRLVTS